MEYAGEIRFGPSYFRLLIDGTRVQGRVFGGEIFWSPDSRLFSAEEWLSTDEAAGPNTRLVLFEPEAKREVVVATCPGGFFDAVAFRDLYLKYAQRIGSSVALHMVMFEDVTTWRPYVVK